MEKSYSRETMGDSYYKAYEDSDEEENDSLEEIEAQLRDREVGETRVKGGEKVRQTLLMNFSVWGLALTNTSRFDSRLLNELEYNYENG